MINELLLQSLTTFYKQNDHIDQLNHILSNQKKISLRLIDWFTTNYSKKYNIIYLIYGDNSGKKTLHNETSLHNNNIIINQFNVYNSYKSQLKAYSKKQFDPFCRRERLKFKCRDSELDTTIGQLNFFKWVINHKIMDYIDVNIDNIETDMNDSLKIVKMGYTKIKDSRKPRQELSISALRGLNKIPMKVLITFD